jgi:hypothetical protein
VCGRSPEGLRFELEIKSDLFEKWTPTKSRDYSLFRIKLRARIARGRLWAYVLVIPQRKLSLVRALHKRRPWSDFELHGWPWGSSPEREERVKGRGEGQRPRLWGGGKEGGPPWRGAAWRRGLGANAARSLLSLFVRKKERRERKRKENKNGKFSKPGNWGGGGKIKDNLWNWYKNKR